MSLFEYSEKFFQVTTSNKNVHYCKCCPYFSTSMFLMINHVRRHRAPKRRFDCVNNTLEIYFCKDCDFHTSLTVLFKKHIQERHVRTQNQRNPANGNALIRRYICAECNFVTYFSLKLMQHVVKTCLKDKVEIFSEDVAQPPRLTLADEEVKVQERPKQSNKPPTIVKFQCNQCQYKSNDELLLGAHKIKEHLPESGTWKQCNECPFKAKKMDQLRDHTICRHLKENEIEWFGCVYCPFRGKLKRALKGHVLRRHPSKKYAEVKCGNGASVALYECKKCPSKFQWKRSLRLHMIAKHEHEPDDIIWYKCDKCSYKSKKSWELAKHQILKHVRDNKTKRPKVRLPKNSSHKLTPEKNLTATHSMGGIKRYDCDKCSYKTKYTCNLLRHQKRIHTDEDKTSWLQCEYCPYKVKFKHLLTDHLKIHKKALQRSKLPPKLKNEKNSITKHSVKHNSKNKKCENLPKLQINDLSHKLKETLNGHLKKVRNAPPKLKISDEPNEKKLTRIQNIGDDTNTRNLRSLPKLQANGGGLTATHSVGGIKWYDCDKCSYKTKYMFHLLRHQKRIHTDEDKTDWLQCEYCPYQVKFKHNLNAHLKTHKKALQRSKLPPKLKNEKNSTTKHSVKDNSKNKKCGDLPKLQINGLRHKLNENLNRHKKDRNAPPKLKRISDEPDEKKIARTQSIGDDTNTRNLRSLPKLQANGVCEDKTNRLNGHFLRKDRNEPPKLKRICDEPEEKKSTRTQSIGNDTRRKSLVGLRNVPNKRKSEEKLTLTPSIGDNINPENSPKHTEMYECKKCSYKLQGKVSLRQHMLAKHTNESKFTWHNCEQCPYKSKVLKDLHYHIICRHLKDDEIDWFQCKYCEYKTKIERGLKNHTDSLHHQKLCEYMRQRDKDCTKTHPCEQCPAILQGEENLKRHVDTKHKTYQCERCNYNTKLEHAWKTHMVKNHNDNDGKKHNDNNGKKPNDSNGKKHSVDIADGKKGPKRVQCKECSYSCAGGQMKRHVIARHTDEKDIDWFNCQHCPYRAKRRDGLKDHIRNRHSGKK